MSKKVSCRAHAHAPCQTKKRTRWTKKNCSYTLSDFHRHHHRDHHNEDYRLNESVHLSKQEEEVHPIARAPFQDHDHQPPSHLMRMKRKETSVNTNRWLEKKEKPSMKELWIVICCCSGHWIWHSTHYTQRYVSRLCVCVGLCLYTGWWYGFFPFFSSSSSSLLTVPLETQVSTQRTWKYTYQVEWRAQSLQRAWIVKEETSIPFTCSYSSCCSAETFRNTIGTTRTATWPFTTATYG